MYKFKVGDRVRWKGCPNEFRDNRHGTIVRIEGGDAIVDKSFSDKLRRVPLKILELDI